MLLLAAGRTSHEYVGSLWGALGEGICAAAEIQLLPTELHRDVVGRPQVPRNCC